jgi:hypothetical protein
MSQWQLLPLLLLLLLLLLLSPSRDSSCACTPHGPLPATFTFWQTAKHSCW